MVDMGVRMRRRHHFIFDYQLRVALRWGEVL